MHDSHGRHRVAERRKRERYGAPAPGPVQPAPAGATLNSMARLDRVDVLCVCGIGAVDGEIEWGSGLNPEQCRGSSVLDGAGVTPEFKTRPSTAGQCCDGSTEQFLPGRTEEPAGRQRHR